MKKLIIVQRTRWETYLKLTDQFADHRDVQVILDRRKQQSRQRQRVHYPDRRRSDRRQLQKEWGARDYIVAYLAQTARTPGRDGEFIIE